MERNLPSGSSVRCCVLVLAKSYLKSRMDMICSKTKHVGLGANWPGVEVIRDLTDRASGIFLWASIASNFIDDDDPRGRINILL